MAIKLEVSKILNGGFEKWRTDGYNDITNPYEWGLESGFGSEYVTRESTIVNNDTYSLKINPGIGNALNYYSHLFGIINDGETVYRLSFYYYITAYETPAANLVKLIEYDEDMSVTQTSTLISLGAGSLNQWVAVAKSLSGTGGGADVTFHADSVVAEIAIEHKSTSGSIMYFDDFVCLGDSITLNKGAKFPIGATQSILQKSGYSNSKDIIAASSINAPLQEIAFNFNRMLKPDYDAIYGFLNSTDIEYSNGMIKLTDNNDDSYFGQLIGESLIMTADFYQGVRGTLFFRESPY